MNKSVILTLLALASPADLSNGENRINNTQAGGSGIPSRAPDLDVLPGFRNPPPGYGQLPFWWWTGDKLDTDRMIGQLRELHKKGRISASFSSRRWTRMAISARLR